jgi:hypothetical protein
MRDEVRQHDAPTRQTAIAWALALAAMLLALMAPALWNGFPLIFSDTGGYLARPFEHTLSIGRSAFYGAFLAAGLPFDFWPNVAIQAALCVWLIMLTLRVSGLGHRPLLTLAVVAGLAVLSSLPWFASQLMPDILLPLAVLGLAVLAFHGDALRRGERAGLAILVAAAIASHMAMLALALLLLLAFALWRLFAPRIAWPRPALPYPAASVAGGIALALVSNLAITGELAFTPGGETFLFGRLIQDGIVGRYLAEHCPDASPRLCPYRNELSPVADDWSWSNDSPLFKLGGWRAFAGEERRIILATVGLYPGAHLRSAIAATFDQLRTTRTIIATSPFDNEDAIRTIAKLAPKSVPAFLAARQQRRTLDLEWINIIHVPVLVLSAAGLVIVAGLWFLRKRQRDTAALALTVLLALVFNAAICGIFSNASDRYQARLIWLAPLCVAIAVLRPRAPQSGTASLDCGAEDRASIRVTRGE